MKHLVDDPLNSASKYTYDPLPLAAEADTTPLLAFWWGVWLIVVLLVEEQDLLNANIVQYMCI